MSCHTSSSKALKMDASIFSHTETYDMYQYGMSSSMTVLKPGLLGMAPMIPALGQLKPVVESLTPHSGPNETAEEDKDKKEFKPNLFQQLAVIEQAFVNKNPVHISQLLGLFSDKQVIGKLLLLTEK